MLILAINVNIIKNVYKDGNSRIVVADPQNDYFTFWDMKNYNKLYQIEGHNFLEMRISDGTVVFFR